MTIKRKITQLAKWLTIGIFIAMLPLVVYVGYVIYTAPIEKITDRLVSLDSDQKVEFEEGTVINELDFKSFYLMSENKKSYELFISEQIEINNLSISKNEIEIKKTFEIEGLFRNTCTEIYCIQKTLKFEEIPSFLWKGLIGIEDRRFIEHSGIDFISISRALIHDIVKMKFEQGGSTLTQQLVKNLLYTNEKKISRKVKEIIISVYLESFYSKEEILESYFNQIYWGSFQGIKLKGVYAASLALFNKRPSELTSYEAAILISMLKGPYYYSPLHKRERLEQRVTIVNSKLKEMNLFSKDNVETDWNKEKWDEWGKKLIEKSKQLDFRALWETRKYDKKLSEYEKYILIKEVKQLVARKKEKIKDIDLAAKVYIYDTKKDEAKIEYYTKIEKKLVNAIEEEKHQIGSLIKPLIYSIFLAKGSSFDDTVKNEKVEFSLVSGKWAPKNSTIIKEEVVTLAEALLKSYNTILLIKAREIGFDVIEEELDKIIPNLKKPLREYPAQLLGSIELSIKEITHIYRDFVKKECAGEARTLNLMADPTLTTIRNRVDENLGRLRFFGKTGTTNNGFDNWFIGFDGRELVLIWVGHEGNRDIGQINLYGSSTAFEIYNNYAKYKGKRFGTFLCENAQ